MHEVILRNDPAPDGRAALVTGAGSGIGRAVADALAADGWRVAVLGRSPEAIAATATELAGHGTPVLPVVADVRDSAAVEQAVAHAEAELGPLRALINNAGVQRLAKAVDVTEADWDDVLDTNLKGAFLCAQAVGRRMLERGSGTVVNVASAAAFVAVEERSAYAASKAGLVMLTRVMALEWASRGVRVNAVAPTFVDTALARQTFARHGAREKIIGSIPMGRLATTDDVVGAVTFLLDERSAGFVTGQVITIDGGFTLG